MTSSRQDLLFRRVLALESSCDDTSVAIVEADGTVLASLIQGQNARHEAFGGVVPEIASRSHSESVLPLVDQALTQCGLSFDDIDGIAVTSRPGLIGSLLVGVVTAKTLALAKQKPFIGVNHLEGHILAPLLRDQTQSAAPRQRQLFYASVVVRPCRRQNRNRGRSRHSPAT